MDTKTQIQTNQPQSTSNKNTKASPNTRNDITFVQCNLGRSSKAQHELSVFIHQQNIDIALVTEPYLGKTNRMKNINGYNIYQYETNRPVKAAILVKENTVSTLGIIQFSNSNLAIVQINKTGKPIYISSVYIEPRLDLHNTLNQLKNFLCETKNTRHIITGDFNGWHTLWGSKYSNKRGQLIADTIFTYDLAICNLGNTATFETITHCLHRQSIIDLTLTTGQLNNSISKWEVNLNVCPSSDHHGITFDVDINHKTIKQKKKLSTFRYNTSRVKWEELNGKFTTEINNNLPTCNIDNLNKSQLENYIIKMISAIQTACDKLLPKTQSRKPRVPWWSEDLEKMKKELIKKHHLIHKLKRKNQPLTDILKEREELKNRYSDAISQASIEHFKDFCSKQKKEDVWSLTNKLLKTKPLSQPEMLIKRNDGNYTKTSTEVAETFLSEHFPDDTIDTTDDQKATRKLMSTTPDTPPDAPFTIEEILDNLNNMNPNKSPGLDHLTADICQMFAKTHPNILIKVLNRCLELSYFPNIWKRAYIRMIPKPNKADPSETSSYRPIGLINVFGKLLEKTVIDRITYHISINNLGNDRQFGFKEQTSTTHALKTAIDLINTHKTNKEHVVAVSLDIQAAFNNAWWPLIFKRLHKINCPSNIYNIMRSYVEDREAQISFVESTASKKLTRGCIQGSVCGPICWNLILDELLEQNLPEGCHIQAFADDVLLISHDTNPDSLQTKTNSALKVITDWGKNA